MARSTAGAALPLLLALLLAACGGGGTTAETGGPSDAPAATDGAANTDMPTDASATDPGAGNGGAATDTCGLVTTEEVGEIFGVSGVTQELIPGPPDSCDYQLDGAPFLVLGHTEQAESFLFDAMAADPDSEAIDGIGDRAVYNSQQLLFVVEVGDAVVSIAAFDPSKTDEERAELLRQVAAIVAGRM